MTGTVALSAENGKTGATLQVKKDGKVSFLEADCIIAADGLNSRL
jgi:2-polyprenyl-6-methoxyphenol hydroxylase-like FAD-dependent oxidoreductase